MVYADAYQNVLLANFEDIKERIERGVGDLYFNFDLVDIRPPPLSVKHLVAGSKAKLDVVKASGKLTARVEFVTTASATRWPHTLGTAIVKALKDLAPLVRVDILTARGSSPTSLVLSAVFNSAL
jgi:hypothetical protein